MARFWNLDGTAGLRVHVRRPVDPDIGLRGQQGTVGAVQHVEETVFRCLEQDLADGAVDLEVGQDHVLGGRVVPGLTRSRLVMPDVLASVGVERHDGRQVQVVTAAGAAQVAVPRRTVADADVEEVQLRVEGHRVPHGSSAPHRPPVRPVPGGGGALHRRVLERQRRIARDRPEPPLPCSRLRVVGGHEATHAVLRAPVADDHQVVDHPGSAGDGVRAFGVDGQGFPEDGPRARVEGHETPVQRAHEHASLPHRHSAIDHVATGVPAPLARHLRVVLPQQFAGPPVVGVHPAPGAGGEQHAVHHDGRGLETALIAGVPVPGETEAGDVRGVDAGQRAVPLLVIGAPVREPVAGLAGRADDPRLGHGRGRGANGVGVGSRRVGRYRVAAAGGERNHGDHDTAGCT